MKIAQIAPLYESVPPRLYGGTERVVSYLTEALIDLGHEVTLFASEDSVTRAELIPCAKTALRLNDSVRDPITYYVLMLERVRRQAHRFDIMHFHIDALHFPLFRDRSRQTVTTLHGRQDFIEMSMLYRSFPEMPLVSISLSQRQPLPDANFVGNVLHGLPIDLLKPTYDPRGGYLAFLGRLSPEKGPDRAIAIARAVGMPLKIAAKIDKADEPYFRATIAPLLVGGDVEFVGEINEKSKASFLGEARALLFPIEWPEPFGLVMIEAMACGTPVLAFGCGSVPEIVDNGVTGRIVSSFEEAIVALGDVLCMDRRRIRARFVERFSANRMAEDYLNVYRTVIQDRMIEAPISALPRMPQVGHRPRQVYVG